jgi:hypothetical protein
VRGVDGIGGWMTPMTFIGPEQVSALNAKFAEADRLFVYEDP